MARRRALPPSNGPLIGAARARIHCLCAYALASYSAAALDVGYAVLDDEALKAKVPNKVVEEAKGPQSSRAGSDASRFD